MTTLSLSKNTNFVGRTLTDIDELAFIKLPDNTFDLFVMKAKFHASQFGTGLISPELAVLGSDAYARDIVQVEGAHEFSAAAWTFSTFNRFGYVRLVGTGSSDTIVGSISTDRIIGSGSADNLSGNAGDDKIKGGSGKDTISGDAGHDKIWGGLGNDSLFGGDGSDWLFGDGGIDTLSGGQGNDVLFNTDWVHDNTADILDGGAGGDRAYLYKGTSTVEFNIDLSASPDWADIGDGTSLRSIESISIEMGSGNDVVTGGRHFDYMRGGAGNDTLSGRGWEDSLHGDEGDDILLGGHGDDYLDGYVGQDRLVGGIGKDYLTGRDGDDRIYGGDGIDRIVGNRGSDVLYGGAGGDTFIYWGSSDSAAGGAIDTIADWKHGSDRIMFTDMGVDFHVIGSAAFDGTRGQIRSVVISGDTHLLLDVNGDMVADWEVKLTGIQTVTDSDFI